MFISLVLLRNNVAMIITIFYCKVRLLIFFPIRFWKRAQGGKFLPIQTVDHGTGVRCGVKKLKKKAESLTHNEYNFLSEKEKIM